MYEKYCKIRDSKGYKDSDVAKGAGITKSTFSDWKSGRSNPKNDKLIKIADFLGVPVNCLMTGTDSDVNSDDSYYLNDDTAKTAQEIFEKDKVLFDVYRSTDKDRLIAYAKKLRDLQKMEKGEE